MAALPIDLHSFHSSHGSRSSIASFLIAASVILFSYCFISFTRAFFLSPVALRRALLDQGIHVKPYRFPAGDLVEIRSLQTQAQKDPIPSPSDHHLLFLYEFPFLHQRICELNSSPGSGCAYSDLPFVLWEGNCPIVALTNPDYVKVAMSSDVKHFQKPPTTHNNFQELVRNDGLLLSDGETWHNHRNLLRPAFFAEKLRSVF